MTQMTLYLKRFYLNYWKKNTETKSGGHLASQIINTNSVRCKKMKNRVVMMYMRVGTAEQLEPDSQKKNSSLLNVETKPKKKKKRKNN